jgi:hypothetical protein
VAPSTIERGGGTVTGPGWPVPAGGGTGSLTVNAQRECSWSARADSSWVSLSATAGQGPATITYSVQANPNASTRRAGVAVEDQRVEISQEPAPCRYQVSPGTVEVAAAGGTIAVGLTAPGGCSWSAQTGAPWLTSEPGSGQGSASIRVGAAPNPAGARDAAISIAGTNVTVHQAGTPVAPPPPNTPCVATLDPSSFNARIDHEDVKIQVRIAGGCRWSSSSPVPWVTVRDGRTGTGNGEVKLRVEENEGPPRGTTLIVADQPFTLTQDGKNKKD